MIGDIFEIYLSTNAFRGLYNIIKYKLKKLNFENVKIENSRSTPKKTLLPEHFQIPEPVATLVYMFLVNHKKKLIIQCPHK